MAGSARREPASSQPLRVTALLAQFSAGGAERQTYELLRRLDPSRYEVSCIVLSGALEPYGPELAARGIEVLPLERRGSYDLARLRRVRRFLDERRVRLIHAIGYEPSAYGYFASRGLRGVELLPSIRSAVLYPRWPKPWIYRLMFRGARRVIVNSHRGAQFAIARFGAPAERTVVIPNGLPFDEIEAASVGPDLRAELGLPAGTPLVGFVGKDSWQKNVRRFLEAAGNVARERPDCHFVLVGWRLGPEDRARLGLDGRASFHTLGVRRDVYRILRALNVLALTSDTEGCPNVVLEAAGLGVPVVASDVGDVAIILGEEGAGGLAASQDPADHAARILRALADREGTRERARRLQQRIRAEYAVERMVVRTAAVYRASAGLPEDGRG
ncbi:MAG: glycosyltransferase [Acidobacteria bacterium]|jgi:glycosyltransferase involved in cell wall biosynthesis|nr:glycosyltransferase [Acidobacteriota bacterium]MCU0253141.1 glycosyltransferase [Acidobacteriota bacterium]